MAEYIVYGHDGWVSSAVAGELIRCEDCKWWHQSNIFPRGQYCTRFRGSDYIWHSLAGDYCSLAERKEDADQE